MADVGRAARLRVQRLLLIARHGVELLERKQRIVAAEHERLLLRADDLQVAWERAAAEARTWADRAAAIDGWPALAAAGPPSGALVRVETGQVMGVEFPSHAAVEVLGRPRTGGSSALAHAGSAMAEAVEAAVAYAAVRRAAASVHAELVATRTRRRAVEHRWIPDLEEDLARIERALDELEREENLRVRWAAGARGGGSPGGDRERTAS
ncbi:V-type ATP synthase subunit D [Demequina rhizosphaerae]|uniref:V-type ATP synthase subunit D n=1 Tax=Demequina rhizosphaerae TaxID=1638985 RepID=UPI0007853664|nr:V-type ATP synthase subunit D [Demequina rhizosphaerae]